MNASLNSPGKRAVNGCVCVCVCVCVSHPHQGTDKDESWHAIVDLQMRNFTPSVQRVTRRIVTVAFFAPCTIILTYLLTYCGAKNL